MILHSEACKQRWAHDGYEPSWLSDGYRHYTCDHGCMIVVSRNEIALPDTDPELREGAQRMFEAIRKARVAEEPSGAAVDVIVPAWAVAEPSFLRKVWGVEPKFITGVVRTSKTLIVHVGSTTYTVFFGTVEACARCFSDIINAIQGAQRE